MFSATCNAYMCGQALIEPLCCSDRMLTLCAHHPFGKHVLKRKNVTVSDNLHLFRPILQPVSK